MSYNPFDTSVIFSQNIPYPVASNYVASQDFTTTSEFSNLPTTNDVAEAISNTNRSVDTHIPISQLEPGRNLGAPTGVSTGVPVAPLGAPLGKPIQVPPGTTIRTSTGVIFAVPPGKVVQVLPGTIVQTSAGVPIQVPAGVTIQTSAVVPPPKKCNAFTCGNNGLCMPFWIYVVLSTIIILGFIFSKQTMAVTLAFFIFQLLWILLFAVIIYYLCKRNKVGWAWFVLLLPLIIQFLWVLFAWLYKLF